MKVVLISTDESNAGIGVRSLSSCLLANGFEIVVVLLPTNEESLTVLAGAELGALCHGAGLIGISCMTHGVRKAVEIRRALRERFPCPMVIGGIHASMAPESLIDEFDLICHGEGEDLIVELARRIRDGNDCRDIPGLWLRHEGGWVKNPSVPLQKDINDYPLPDYDLAHQFILSDSRIVPMEMQHVSLDYFVVLGSRGCPHHCSYCSSRGIKERFPWRKKVRHYTTESLLANIKSALCRFPAIRTFWIDDDTFFAKSIEEIRAFIEVYRREVGKPFQVLISPWTFSEAKLKLLIENGLERLIMGVQSGSENTTRNMYSRNLSNEKLLEIAGVLHSYADRMGVYYDFIGMNPFEDRADLLSTIRFIRQLPPPFFIYNNNLAFYPGTELYKRAVQEKVDLQYRFKHSDPMIGYNILRRRKMGHSLLHLILLRMQGPASTTHIGQFSRKSLQDGWLLFFEWLDERFPRLINRIVSMVAQWLPHIDRAKNLWVQYNWRCLLKAVWGTERVAWARSIIRRISGT